MSILFELVNLGNGSAAAGDKLAADICREAIGEIEQLQADNARLTKMLELAADRTIDYTIALYYEHPWKQYYARVHGLRIAGKGYTTPIEVLEAAFEEWEKENNLTA